MLKKLRSLTLLAGVFVSWYATISAFIRFNEIEGTIFKFQDCTLPNPVTTPCFWGAIAFLIAFAWSIKLLAKVNEKHEKYLFYLLIASVLFAWVNFAIELKGVEPTPNSPFSPCPVTTTNPFLSPCFFGSILFTISMFCSSFLSKKSL